MPPERRKHNTVKLFFVKQKTRALLNKDKCVDEVFLQEAHFQLSKKDEPRKCGAHGAAFYAKCQSDAAYSSSLRI